jgi:MerR family transcriptional regulator, copper efflux regulator
VTAGLRISDVARQSGFSAATLRYYEDIGLLPPPERAGNRYRLYDDRTLDRLAFIARARQLGCTLEEIADLSAAWDGGECGPLQDRLRTTVVAKQADARRRIAELVLLTDDLLRAAAALEQHRPDGPCDDRCGCTSTPSPEPIACTLAADAMPGRMDDWGRMLDYVEARSVIDGGIRLDLRTDVPVDELVRLAGAEHECCRFFAFAITVDERGTGLEVRAAGDGLAVVHALFGAPA